MSDKCSKYEGLFIFSSKEALQEHLDECPDCLREHEKMNKTASVVKEVSDYYENFEPQRHSPVAPTAIKAAAGLIVVVLAYFVINQSILDNDINGYNLSQNTNESVISEMGLPTDDYGLLMVY